MWEAATAQPSRRCHLLYRTCVADTRVSRTRRVTDTYSQNVCGHGSSADHGLVGPDQLLVGQLVRIEHIGRHQEGGFALHGTGHRFFLDRDRRLDLPLEAMWRGTFTRASRMALLGLGDEAGLHLEPLGTFLEVRSEGGLGIGLVGER